MKLLSESELLLELLSEPLSVTLDKVDTNYNLYNIFIRIHYVGINKLEIILIIFSILKPDNKIKYSFVHNF